MSVSSIQHSVIQSTVDYSKDSSKDKNDLVILIDASNQVVTTPKGWKRILTDNNKIIYISPSQHIICNQDELSNYLRSHGTCKCNLTCPFFINELFNFDPQVESVEDCSFDEIKQSCKHRHKDGSRSISNNVNNNFSNTTSYIEQPKIIYTTSTVADNPKGSPSKLIIQNPVLSNVNKANGSSNNYQTIQTPINIQQLLNFKQNDQIETTDGRIYGYIPIKGDNLTNLNILNQPIIFTSPIKSNNKTETKVPVLQFLNSPVIQQGTQVFTVQQANNSKAT